MEIEKKTELFIKDNDGVRINENDLIMFDANGYTLIGHFKGITKHGALNFTSPTGAEFNIKPSGITNCHHVILEQ